MSWIKEIMIEILTMRCAGDKPFKVGPYWIFAKDRNQATARLRKYLKLTRPKKEQNVIGKG